ncbi:hypothetical protein ACJX0J_021299, partial [Zea mays]
CITTMKISFLYLCFYDCFLSWEVGGFFYHEYINKKTLFFASNINQFDLYSSLVDNFSLEISKADHILNKMNATKRGNKKGLNTPTQHTIRRSAGTAFLMYYEMIISLDDWGVFVYYFCNIMSFDIF